MRFTSYLASYSLTRNNVREVQIVFGVCGDHRDGIRETLEPRNLKTEICGMFRRFVTDLNGSPFVVTMSLDISGAHGRSL